MLDFSSKSLGLWAGIGTAAFLGYCIYFDRYKLVSFIIDQILIPDIIEKEEATPTSAVSCERSVKQPPEEEEAILDLSCQTSVIRRPFRDSSCKKFSWEKNFWPQVTFESEGSF